MILSDNTIKRMVKSGKLCDTELSNNIDVISNVQPASLDITVGNSFISIDAPVCSEVVEFDVPIEYKEIVSDSYLLLPKQFVLATTNEYIKLPNNITAFVEGRSSIGRLGLFIQNAGWVDPGFEGQITLELFNASNYAINIKSGTRVGQLVFAKMDYDAQNPYTGKYQGQTGATGSMIYKDFYSI